MVPQNVVLGTPSPTTTPQEDMGTKTHLSSAQRTQIHQYTDTIPNFSAGINWRSKEPHKSPSQLDPFIQIAPSPSQEISHCKIPPDSSTEEKTHFTSFEKLVLQYEKDKHID